MTSQQTQLFKLAEVYSAEQAPIPLQDYTLDEIIEAMGLDYCTDEDIYFGHD